MPHTPRARRLQCWKQYEAKRIAGLTAMAALDATLFGGEMASESCIALR